MATHSSILAWRSPWIEEPGGLESMGSQRVGHDQATKTDIRQIMQTGQAVWGLPLRLVLTVVSKGGRGFCDVSG